MATFSLKSLSILETKVKDFSIDIPLIFCTKIGEGTSASIFKYELKGDPVAVKIFKYSLSKQRTLQVADKLRKLVCPHLVVFRGYSLRPSAFIFDFCGVNVGDECLPLKTLHDFGIVHRDFKPSNLLVTGTLSKLCVKLTDFDDLSLIQETVNATLTNKVFLFGMTLAYTAPEICKQEVKSPSFKSDIYSWSMSAYEVLSGYESPWVNIIPILNDSLLIEALSQDKRPNINDLNQFYTFNNETWIFKMICNAWDTNPDVRKDIDKILKTLNKDRSKQTIKPKQDAKIYPLNERRQEFEAQLDSKLKKGSFISK
nr:putative serine/threonine-protein kinase [Hydra vulgaris]